MPTLQLLQDVQTRLERKREEGQIEKKEGGLREGGRNMRVIISRPACMGVSAPAVRNKRWQFIIEKHIHNNIHNRLGTHVLTTHT